jgi:voltage-gated potassium channel
MNFRHLRISLTLLCITLVFGTLSYHFIESMSFFDAFYMTIITVSTVGFSELKPLSPVGRIVTIIIISTGIMIGAYTIGMLVRMFIEGELKKTFGRRKMEKQISKLKEHFIICGYGRIGKLICEELLSSGIDFVVIEQDPAAIETLESREINYIHMDATSEEALIDAGIMSARGIVTAVMSDADNVFITLTAKGIRSDIFILSRASDHKNEIKLQRAGASRVVSPYLIGGKRMAQVLIKPTVVDFIDIALMDSDLGLMMEEAEIGPHSNLIGKSLVDSNLRQDFGVIIVAIKKQSGNMIFNPTPSERLEENDVIVVIGKNEEMERMNAIL